MDIRQEARVCEQLLQQDLRNNNLGDFVAELKKDRNMMSSDDYQKVIGQINNDVMRQFPGLTICDTVTANSGQEMLHVHYNGNFSMEKDVLDAEMFRSAEREGAATGANVSGSDSGSQQAATDAPGPSLFQRAKNALYELSRDHFSNPVNGTFEQQLIASLTRPGDCLKPVAVLAYGDQSQQAKLDEFEARIRGFEIVKECDPSKIVDSLIATAIKDQKLLGDVLLDSHGAPGCVLLNGNPVRLDGELIEQLKRLRPYMHPLSRFIITGCNVGEDEAAVQKVSDALGVETIAFKWEQLAGKEFGVGPYIDCRPHTH